MSKVTILDEYRQRKGLPMSFGTSLAIAREKRGLTQQQLVERFSVKIDRSVISKWENGVLYPQPEDAVEAANALLSPELLKEYCKLCPVHQALMEIMPKPAA